MNDAERLDWLEHYIERAPYGHVRVNAHMLPREGGIRGWIDELRRLNPQITNPPPSQLHGSEEKT